MRQDRNGLLQLFIIVSVVLHAGLLITSRSMNAPLRPGNAPAEIEIALQPTESHTPSLAPIAPARPTPTMHPTPHPASSSGRKSEPHVSAGHIHAIVHTTAKPTAPTSATPNEVPNTIARSAAPKPDPLAKLIGEKPQALGLPNAPVSVPHLGGVRNKVDPASPLISPNVRPEPAQSGLSADTPPDGLTTNKSGAGPVRTAQTASPGAGIKSSVLASENPLASLTVQNDRPGALASAGVSRSVASSGRGGGGGSPGSALSALRSRPGSGIGAGTGSGAGSPGSGTGKKASADLPSGIGSGGGKGTGPGYATGGPGVSGISRGVPFGDVAGLLDTGGSRDGARGGSGARGGGDGGRDGEGNGESNGPGATTRGGVFGSKGGNGLGSLHVIYVLDCSGSMRDGNKIGKAKQALKKALSELKPSDSFNVLAFNWRVYPLSPGIMLPASRDIIEAAYLWIDRLDLANHTNISGALGAALRYDSVNLVYLMSDGEPEGRETLHDPDEIRTYVKQSNIHNARIMTLALCLGERYPGERLMRGLADDGGGEYNYIDLSKIR